jgi:hypothetical protein
MSATRSQSSDARRRQGESGVVLVEFAFVLFPLLLIVLGMLDFGRAMNYWIQQTHLSNEGARWAVVNAWPGCAASDPPMSCTPSLQQYVHGQLEAKELKEKAKVCIDAGAVPGDPVTVTVSSPFKWFGFFTGFATISSKATMRTEAVPTHYIDACYPTS